MNRLRGPVKSVLCDAARDDAVARMWARIEARSTDHTRVSARWSWPLLAAVGGFLLVVLAATKTTREEGRPNARGPVRLATGAVLAGTARATAEPLVLALQDGSALRLEQGAVLKVLQNSEEEVELEQPRGRASYDIVPGGPRHWTILAGEVRVEVVGTRFAVERDGRSTRVAVERGVVLVAGEHVPGGVVRLTPGTSVAVESQDWHVGKGVERTENLRSAPRRPVVALQPRPGRESDRRAVENTDSVGQLFAQADQARLGGEHERALEPLARIVVEHPGDSRAGLAALTLGRLQLRAMSRPERCAESVAQALALGLPAALRLDAYALLVEALARSGDTARASAAYERCRAEVPECASAAEIARWVHTP